MHLANFRESPECELRQNGVLGSCASPSNTSHLASLCNTAGLITPSRSTGGAQPMETHPAVRPFRVDVPEEDLDDLRRRIAATRWPERETVDAPTVAAYLAVVLALRVTITLRARAAA